MRRRIHRWLKTLAMQVLRRMKIVEVFFKQSLFLCDTIYLHLNKSVFYKNNLNCNTNNHIYFRHAVNLSNLDRCSQ